MTAATTGVTTFVWGASSETYGKTTAIDVTADGGVDALSGVDIIVGVKAGDKLDLSEVTDGTGIADTTTADGTTTLADDSAGGIALITGSYAASTQKFTSGARSSSNNDYLVQWAWYYHSDCCPLDTSFVVDSLVTASGIATVTT